MKMNLFRHKSPRFGVKVSGLVKSRTVPGLFHRILYLRTQRTRLWLCSCHDFLFRQFSKRRNCDHIREARERYGRFGTKVPLT